MLSVKLGIKLIHSLPTKTNTSRLHPTTFITNTDLGTIKASSNKPERLKNDFEHTSISNYN